MNARERALKVCNDFSSMYPEDDLAMVESAILSAEQAARKDAFTEAAAWHKQMVALYEAELSVARKRENFSAVASFQMLINCHQQAAAHFTALAKEGE